ncbi:hypothetical protein C8Q80DRAFT_1273523 [Daedaleopsis nitida]|nr:hypothetical protein C8Q80DRAFT_1273523 [Daedaleopsis nitida]
MNLDDYLVPGTSSTYYIPEFVTEDEEEYLIRKKKLRNRGGGGWPTAGMLQIWGKAPVRGDLTAKKTLIPQDMPSFVSTYPDVIGRIRDTGAFMASAHGQPNHIIMNEYAPGQGIMPHEDGPAYHPVVATLSLGAHTVFHYYQYASDERPDSPNRDPPSQIPTKDATPPGAVATAMGGTSGTGRPIDPTPVLSLLLEPRSLVITTAALYTSHLHGIDEVTEDSFAPGGRSPGEKIANAGLLHGQAERTAVGDGGTLERGLRYSLTCRDVEKVTAAGGALFRKLRG